MDAPGLYRTILDLNCQELLSFMDFFGLSWKVRWCERGDSNPHGCPLEPKSSASTNSATLAKCANALES